jgi:hypothetical protein
MMALHYERKDTKSAETRRVAKKIVDNITKEAGRYKFSIIWK